jgi:ATP citrate (pro-S)-lyase
LCVQFNTGVTIIGPATVGGIKPGCFRIGNTGGMLDNIVSSKLYRAGSVAYVARSGGMSNELNNIIAQCSDGVYEGVAIGGDRFSGSTFTDHLLRYQRCADVKILVVLGEVGGVEEYEIIKLMKSGAITKPLIAWCIGTCSKMFSYEVQFGHAGACAHNLNETADSKNKALKDAGAFVPDSFQDFGRIINQVYCQLLDKKIIQLKQEISPPVVPVDYDWARKLGLIRKSSGFISSISDERGDELKYGGMKVSKILEEDMGIGGVVGLLWFRRKLPKYVCTFIETVLMLFADHGPAVSGAHNTIVCARAGKDMVSSVASGLLTVGPRFGGALDGAAQLFSWAFDNKMTPDEFVEYNRKNKQLIPGIGHKIKSLEDPDMRVVMIKKFVAEHFPSAEIFNYALQVEQLTTKKKSSLILNVDGAIATAFVDILRSSGAFTADEAQEYINLNLLNGLFVVGRSIGFIGHWIDQNRLKQGLYRHPTEDISYITEFN